MNTQASFALRGRNPDVLTCIANLSSDEVFTPPEFANRMLDTLADSWAEAHGGADIWSDNCFTLLPNTPKRIARTRPRKGTPGATQPIWLKG